MVTDAYRYQNCVTSLKHSKPENFQASVAADTTALHEILTFVFEVKLFDCSELRLRVRIVGTTAVYKERGGAATAVAIKPTQHARTHTE